MGESQKFLRLQKIKIIKENNDFYTIKILNFFLKYKLTKKEQASQRLEVYNCKTKLI